jgi:hypothetical protein
MMSTTPPQELPFSLPDPHYDFSGNPVVPVDELSDRIALVQRDFGIEGTAQDENCCRFR